MPHFLRPFTSLFSLFTPIIIHNTKNIKLSHIISLIYTTKRLLIGYFHYISHINSSSSIIFPIPLFFSVSVVPTIENVYGISLLAQFSLFHLAHSFFRCHSAFSLTLFNIIRISAAGILYCYFYYCFFALVFQKLSLSIPNKALQK